MPPLMHETTVQLPIWPLKTESQIDEAAHDLLHSYDLHSVVERNVDEFRRRTATLTLFISGQPFLARENCNLMLNADGSPVCLSDDELTARGLPVPPSP